LIELDGDIRGKRHDLRQGQVFWALRDKGDPGKRVVIVYTLTCTYRQFRDFGREFQDFMASVSPAAEDGAS
jgi:hypothetical protein